MGKIADGTYITDALGVARLISGPEWSREAYDTLEKALRAGGAVLSDPTVPDPKAYAAWYAQLKKAWAWPWRSSPTSAAP